MYKPFSNTTPFSGIVLSTVVLSVPTVLALNSAVPPPFGSPLRNEITPAVPPETIE
mgnify:CR=1 FL=1